MNLKKKAHELRKQGLSYLQIAKKLGVGKSTAHTYVKEYRLSTDGANASLSRMPPSYQDTDFNLSNRPISSLSAVRKGVQNVLPNGSARVRDGVAPREQNDKPSAAFKEFTGDELIRKKFDCLEFTGGFKELIGKPSRKFSAIIWGKPKGGKSHLALRFADYLQEYFGDVVYIAAEEGESVTLQEKFVDLKGSRVMVFESRNLEEIDEYLSQRKFEFVFIDSINTAGINNESLERLKESNPRKSFIAIVQATKGGNFKGDQALTHNCDFIIKVVDGIAYHTGRFNIATEKPIFESAWYEKNTQPRHLEPRHAPAKNPLVLDKPVPDALQQSKTRIAPLANVAEVGDGEASQLRPSFPRVIKPAPKPLVQTPSQGSVRPISPKEAWGQLLLIGLFAVASNWKALFKNSKIQ